MAPDERDHRALSNAIEAGDVTTVRTLVARFPELVNHPDWTPPPLHCAVLWNRPAVAESLLDLGADVEMRDPDRATPPLRYAIVFARPELIPLLLARGANAGVVDEGGTTALGLARDAANGAFEEYEDLPSRDAYAAVLDALRECGIDE